VVAVAKVVLEIARAPPVHSSRLCRSFEMNAPAKVHPPDAGEKAPDFRHDAVEGGVL